MLLEVDTPVLESVRVDLGSEEAGTGRTRTRWEG